MSRADRHRLLAPSVPSLSNVAIRSSGGTSSPSSHGSHEADDVFLVFPSFQLLSASTISRLPPSGQRQRGFSVAGTPQFLSSGRRHTDRGRESSRDRRDPQAIAQSDHTTADLSINPSSRCGTVAHGANEFAICNHDCRYQLQTEKPLCCLVAPSREPSTPRIAEVAPAQAPGSGGRGQS
jgi:hypothetical protein